MAHIRCSRVIEAPKADVFKKVTDLKLLPQLMLPLIDVELLQVPEVLGRNSKFEINMTRFGLSQKVMLRVDELDPQSGFLIKQQSGLFKTWVQREKLEDHGKNNTLVTDLVEYQWPLGLFGYLADDLFLRREVKVMIEHRLERISQLFDQ